MEWISVSSSNLNAVAYDKDLRSLFIRFNDGREYRYFEVPEQEFNNLLNAFSHGKYFHNYIKKNYRYSRIG